MVMSRTTKRNQITKAPASKKKTVKTTPSGITITRIKKNN